MLQTKKYTESVSYISPYKEMDKWSTDKQSPVKLPTNKQSPVKELFKNAPLINVPLAPFNPPSIHPSPQFSLPPPSSSSNIYVSYNKLTKYIMFKENYHPNKLKHDPKYPEPIDIGKIDHLCLLKNVSNHFDQSNIFLTDHNNQQSLNLAKLMVGYLVEDENNKYKVYIHTNNDSPLMGDVEILIYLNNNLKEFMDTGALENELKKLDIRKRGKINKYIKLFIYSLLEYTINLINTNLTSINNPILKENMKIYVETSLNRLNHYTREVCERNSKKYKVLKENIETIGKIKTMIYQKVSEIDEQMKMIMEKIKEMKVGGGEEEEGEEEGEEDTKKSLQGI